VFGVVVLTGQPHLSNDVAHDALHVIRIEGVTFRTLGRYALAGLPEPEAIFQVDATDLRVTFPKLRVTAVRATPATRRS